MYSYHLFPLSYIKQNFISLLNYHFPLFIGKEKALGSFIYIYIIFVEDIWLGTIVFILRKVVGFFCLFFNAS